MGRITTWVDIGVMKLKVKGHRGHKYLVLVITKNSVRDQLHTWLVYAYGRDNGLNRFRVTRSKVIEVIVYMKMAHCHDNLGTI